MKKLFFTLFVLVSFVSLSSCSSSDTAKKLDGTWLHQESEDGSEIEMTWTFNSADETAKLVCAAFNEGVKSCIVEVEASYTATPDELTLVFDKGPARAYVTDEAKEKFGMSESIAKQIADATLQQIGDVYTGTNSEKIVKLTDSELVMEEAGSEVAFKKQ